MYTSTAEIFSTVPFDCWLTSVSFDLGDLLRLEGVQFALEV